jgi:hypothetical protein
VSYAAVELCGQRNTTAEGAHLKLGHASLHVSPPSSDQALVVPIVVPVVPRDVAMQTHRYTVRRRLEISARHFTLESIYSDALQPGGPSWTTRVLRPVEA